MKKKKASLLFLILGIIFIFMIACERELPPDEIVELEAQISQKYEEINRLKKVNSIKDSELKELRKSINMIRFSSYARLNDYSDNFDNLVEVYRINSKHEIKDDWYIINDDYFDIELLGYEDAIKVDFYILRLESGEGPVLLFADTEYTDGWIYTNNSISESIERHSSSNGFLFEPYFVVYAEVTLEDGNIKRLPKIPIYYR